MKLPSHRFESRRTVKENRAYPQRYGPIDVLLLIVHEESLLGMSAKRFEDEFEGASVRLAGAEIAGVEGGVDETTLVADLDGVS